VARIKADVLDRGDNFLKRWNLLHFLRKRL
jgi:hypothetical protein